MQTKKLTKFIYITIAIIFITLLTTGGSVQAALQANPSAHYKKTDNLTNWVTNIRKMEEAGGAMGLTETLGTDLVSTISNNIDVHCIRSTEYGAMAILSASGYGNPNKIPTSGEGSSTGNNTGVLVNSSYDHLTAGIFATDHLKGVNARYYDLYNIYDTNSTKAGDALGTASTTNPGCAGWHSASSNSWGLVSYNRISRGKGGIFSVSTFSNSGVAITRVAAVCGEGL